LRIYETIFILDPSLSDDVFEGEIKKVTELIQSKNGNILKTDRWGKRKLTYPIDKKTEGYYVFLLYQSSSNLPKELESYFRLNESYIRYLTVVSQEKADVTEEEKA